MNALEVQQHAAILLGLYPDTTALSAYNTDNQLLYILYEVARYLRKTQAFPQQKRVHTLTYTASRSSYPLPEDFYASVGFTHMNQTDSWELVGPIHDGEWNYTLYGPGITAPRDQYRIFGMDGNPSTDGGQFQIIPTPAATDTISFEYISKTMFFPENWTASTVYTAGDAANANGNIYTTATGGTSGSTEPTGTSTAGDISDGGITDWTYQSAAKETVTADDDYCIFDDDVVIAGIRAFYLRTKGQDNSQEMKEFMDMIQSARSRWYGNSIISGDKTWRRPRHYTQSGSWDL